MQIKGRKFRQCQLMCLNQSRFNTGTENFNPTSERTCWMFILQSIKQTENVIYNKVILHNKSNNNLIRFCIEDTL